jgi:hypothetical protein
MIVENGLVLYRNDLNLCRRKYEIEDITFLDFNIPRYKINMAPIIIFIDADKRIKFLKNRY